MRVAGTFPSRISRIENLLLAMMTSVPFSTGALMYSSFAPAPFAPFLDAPWQNFLYSSIFFKSSSVFFPLISLTREFSSEISV